MKKLFSILIILLLLLNCTEEKPSKNKTFNPFNVSKVGESQFFDLDTIQLKEITGKYGTKIYFDRNSFNVKGTDKITMELKEFYNIQDLIENNIRTLTKDNELLESSGVIFLNFKRNGEDIELAGNSTIGVRFPIELSKQDQLFSGTIDTTGQISWAQTESYFTVMRYNKTYAIDIPFEITLDSLPYYRELWRKQDSIYELTAKPTEKIESKVGTSLTFNKLGWINIDKLVTQTEKFNFSINNGIEVDGLVIYIVYENLNSFTSYYPEDTKNILLMDIPIAENTSLIAVGLKDKNLFAYKVPIKDKKAFNLSLKPIMQTELEELFEK